MIVSDNSFIIWRAAADEAEIITIGVAPNARCGGIATNLVCRMENELKKRGVIKVFLDVAANNLPAIKLYEKNGFIRVGMRNGYYRGIDGIVMRKSL